MCRAFSCIVERNSQVHWKLGVDSHSSLLEKTPLKDDTSDPKLMTFARVEITPKNGNYFTPDEWQLKVDQAITPDWFGELHKVAAFSAHKKWLAKLDKIIVRKAIVRPFKIVPPAEITKKHINMLRKWDSVRASVGDSVRASAWDSVGDSVWASARDSVRASVGDSVWDSAWASAWASVGDSVGDSAWAYIGSFFRLPQWKYIKHPKHRYPFGPCVQLWELGLVPSFDGTTWRLHGGPKAAVLFQITAEELKK